MSCLQAIQRWLKGLTEGQTDVQGQLLRTPSGKPEVQDEKMKIFILHVRIRDHDLPYQQH